MFVILRVQQDKSDKSAEREMYVWSDTDEKYTETRIIFLDTEKSNWTWDAEAGAYFWHRLGFEPMRSSISLAHKAETLITGPREPPILLVITVNPL